jgi:hypothetical protein
MSLLWPKREADKTYDTVELRHDPEKCEAVFRIMPKQKQEAESRYEIIALRRRERRSAVDLRSRHFRITPMIREAIAAACKP